MATERAYDVEPGVRRAESDALTNLGLEPAARSIPTGRELGRMTVRNAGRVEVEMVIPDPDQPRVEFSEDAIERLALSIRDRGQLSPIWVRWSDALGKWVIISGERRWRATRRAGLPTIDCRFHEGEPTRSEILEQQLIENLLREDLQAMEEARSFSTLMEINGWSGKQLAEALRVPASKVSRSLALLRLPEVIQDRVARGEIAARSAYELSKVGDERALARLADRAAAGSMTHAALARAARSRKGTRAPRPKSTHVTLVADGGWKVVVSAGRKGTYDEVERALMDALEEVQARIQNNVQLY